MLRKVNVLLAAVPDLSPSNLLAEIEARAYRMDLETCQESLGAVGRLNAALTARYLTLAVPARTDSTATSPDLVDAKAAARRLGVSLPTLYRLARSGALSSVRIGPDSLRFSPRDLERFVDSRRSGRGE